VANIAGDCAAIIPESMKIEFIETGNVGAASDLYLKRADWLDRQISKAVLGQTATTDAITGGLGSGKEHRQVQEDIERADAVALAAILNRDLIRPWIDLEFGPQKRYPRLKIGRPEPEDLDQLVKALGILVPLGLKVEASEIRDKFKLSEPGENAEILGAVTAAPPPGATTAEAPAGNPVIKRVSGEFKQGQAQPGIVAAQSVEAAPSAKIEGVDPEAVLADRLATEAEPHMADMIGQIEAMLQAAGDLDEFRAMLMAAYGEIGSGPLAQVLAQGMIAAHVGGRQSIEDENG
jgi:phage gp29-like protein